MVHTKEIVMVSPQNFTQLSLQSGLTFFERLSVPSPCEYLIILSVINILQRDLYFFSLKPQKLIIQPNLSAYTLNKQFFVVPCK